MRSRVVWAAIAILIILAISFASVTNEFTGATKDVSVCGNNDTELAEECDLNDSISCGLCPKDSHGDRDPDCLANSCNPDCTCKQSYCGNHILERGEQCEMGNDTACPNLCRFDCTCKEFAPSAIGTSFSYTALRENQTVTEEFTSANVPITKLSFTIQPKIEYEVKGQENPINFVPNAKISILSDVATSTRNFTFNYFIYQKFEIKLENLEDQFIANATIGFRIPDSWFKDNKIDSTSVRLFRAAPSWVSLPTQLSKEESGYKFYTAESPGLSVFVVGGQEAAPAPTTERAAVCGNGILESGENVGNCCADAGCPNNLTCVSNSCKLVILCGNGVCEQTEDVLNCAQDCTRQALFSPNALVVLILLIVTAGLAYLSIKPKGVRKPKVPLMPGFASEEETLKEYVSEGLKKGITTKALRNELLAGGFDPKLVEKIIHELRPEL